MEITTWILVSDTSKAAIYSVQKASLFLEGNEKKLKLIENFTHANSRKKDSDLVSDKMGSYGLGNFSSDTDPKYHEADIFAHELVKKLDQARKEDKYRDIILIAPPAFMGLINKNLNHETSKLVSLKIEKEYSGDNEQHLLAHLLKYL